MDLSEQMMLIGIIGWRATLSVVHWLFLLAIPVLQSTPVLSFASGDIWYPVRVLSGLCSTTSIDSVGHAPAATERLQQIVVSTQLICVFDNKCAVWAEAPSGDATSSHMLPLRKRFTTYNNTRLPRLRHVSPRSIL